MASVKAEKNLGDYARDAIERLPHKRIFDKEEMKWVIHEAIKANALALIKPEDEEWVVRNKEITANALAELTAAQLDYQWQMQYVVWSDFIKQR